MSAQQRLAALYDAQCAPTEAAEIQARALTEADEGRAQRWVNDARVMLPTLDTLMRRWLGEMEHLKTDMGLQRQQFELKRLKLTWEGARWRRVLPLRVAARIVGYTVGIAALTLAFYIRLLWRWIWAHRRVLLIAAAALLGVVALVALITFIVTELPNLLRPSVGPNP